MAGDLYAAAGVALAAASIVGAAIGTYVKLTVRSELSAFKAELIESLDERFVSRRESEAVVADIFRRLDGLEGRKR
jgi:hypothetical protein